MFEIGLLKACKCINAFPEQHLQYKNLCFKLNNDFQQYYITSDFNISGSILRFLMQLWDLVFIKSLSN